MLYNLIGDIHGRKVWQQLVREDAVNIFMGDYLDPYHGEGIVAGEDDYNNLQEIIRFKKEHPETILLLGNHDLHYVWEESYSRRASKKEHIKRNEACFRDNFHLFQMAYAIGKRILVTHAGVTLPWCEMAGVPTGLSTAAIADMLNQMGMDDDKRLWFATERCMPTYDHAGYTPSASPVWVRPETLRTHAHLMNPDGKEIIQIVGHTQIEAVTLEHPFFFIDCLGYITQSLLVDYSDQGGYDFAEYEPKKNDL